MHASATDRNEFVPPPQRGLVRGFVLAVIAHLLLVAALMHGLQWKREAENVAAEAELWSRVPQEAAPQAVPPPPPPVVQAPPVVQPPPVVKAPPEPEPPAQREADIAAEREKRKQEAAERRQAELERERDRRKKLEAQQKKEEELERKQEQAKLAAAEKRKAEDDRKRRQQEAESKRLAQQREDNLKRIQAMAGTGAPSATGNAAQSSGPSSSWAGRVQARVRPNIVYSADAGGNLKAEVEVRLAPDGTIVGKRLVKSSGAKAWDEAVLRALDKTETLPRDVDGRVPTQVVIEFRP